jgi:hypothetical protein
MVPSSPSSPPTPRLSFERPTAAAWAMALLASVSIVGTAIYLSSARSLLVSAPATFHHPKPHHFATSPPPPHNDMMPLFVGGLEALHISGKRSPLPPPINVWAVPPRAQSTSKAKRSMLPLSSPGDRDRREPAAQAGKGRAAFKFDTDKREEPPFPDRAATGSRGSTASSIAIHRSARNWLEGCVNTSSVPSALPSSEYWRERRTFLFYRHLLCIVQRYAPTAASVLDVGSSLPPFVLLLNWVKSKTILGPKFAGNVAKGGSELLSLSRIEEKFRVSVIQADFLEWQPSGMGASLFDLVLCSEVVEHISKPREFVRKLLTVGRVVVLSAPYRWEPCEGRCHHKQNKITRDRIGLWAGRQPVAYDIVEESSGDQRIICVFTHA